ncbi:MAG TPA: serine/threonine-protein kinase, partial [Micromonosporaceae bacterium]
EYVDGPSLAEVVAERGPLTPANLHGLAIGVATALTAIHGAGVIHRDLKPSNVLLAPGTPKVIDFGIARAAEGAPDGETRTDQLMGTVAYMAPERLEPAIERTLTSAADIFAWGAVVAFAATGRVPFAGDSGPATAIAILTQKPNLDGIAEPLRRLVRRALAKRPEARPSARQLLDELLSIAPRPASDAASTPAAAAVVAAGLGAAGADAVADGAANGAAAAGVGIDTGSTPTVVGSELVTDRIVATVDAADDDSATGFENALTSGLALAHVDVTDDNAGASAERNAPTTLIRPARQPDDSGLIPFNLPPDDGGLPHDDGGVAGNGYPPYGNGNGSYGNGSGGVGRRSSLRGLGIAVLVVCVLASAGAVTGLLTGVLKLPANHPSAAASTSSTPPPSTAPVSSAPPSSGPPSASASSDLPDFPYMWIDDPLTTDNYWQHTKSTTKYNAGCEFSPDGLTATLQNLLKTHSYRCTGPTPALGDFRVVVTVTLGSSDSCATIWFRFNQSQAYGYALQICAGEMKFGTHSGSLFAPVNTTQLRPALTADKPVRFAIVAAGDTFTILGCAVSSIGCEHPRQLAQITNSVVTTPGEITLGIYEPTTATKAESYDVTFADIQVNAATPPPPPPPSPSPSTSTVTPPAVEPSPSTSSSSASP